MYKEFKSNVLYYEKKINLRKFKFQMHWNKNGFIIFQMHWQQKSLIIGQKLTIIGDQYYCITDRKSFFFIMSPSAATFAANIGFKKILKYNFLDL